MLFWAGGVGFLEVQWRARVAWVLIKKQLDEDSGRWLPIVLVLTDVIAYALVFLVAFDLVEIHEFRMLIFLIVWHLFSAVYLFLRLIRHSGVKISTADNRGDGNHKIANLTSPPNPLLLNGCSASLVAFSNQE